MARVSKPQAAACEGLKTSPAVDAICLLAAGLVRAVLPTSEFTLAWQHSVEKTRWEERYRIEGARLVLAEARVQGLGAGMEPPAGARFAHGRWTWRPALAPLPELSLTASRYTDDYRLCWGGTCTALARIVGPLEDGAVVRVLPCRRSASARTAPPAR